MNNQNNIDALVAVASFNVLAQNVANLGQTVFNGKSDQINLTNLNDSIQKCMNHLETIKEIIKTS